MSNEISKVLLEDLKDRPHELMRAMKIRLDSHPKSKGSAELFMILSKKYDYFDAYNTGIGRLLLDNLVVNTRDSLDKILAGDTETATIIAFRENTNLLLKYASMVSDFVKAYDNWLKQDSQEKG